MLQQSLARMMAAEDVRGAMGWSDEERDQAARPLRRQQQEVVEEPEEYPEEEAAPAERAQPPAAAGEAAAPAADENEIELAEDEDEEEGAAGASGEAQQPELDPELEALARAPGPSAAAAAPEEPARDRQQEAARGEPRSWDDLSDGEQEGEALGGSGVWGWQYGYAGLARAQVWSAVLLAHQAEGVAPRLRRSLAPPSSVPALPCLRLNPPWPSLTRCLPLPAEQITASARRGCTRPRRCPPPPTPGRTSSQRTKIDACWSSCGRRWAAPCPLACAARPTRMPHVLWDRPASGVQQLLL